MLFTSIAFLCFLLVVIAVAWFGVTSLRPPPVENELAFGGFLANSSRTFAKFWTNNIVNDELLENHHETTDNPVKRHTCWCEEGEDDNHEWAHVNHFLELFSLHLVFYSMK